MTGPDTLTGLAREVAALTRTRASFDAPTARALAERLERFAADNPGLDSSTRMAYLVRLARCIDPTCDADTEAALTVLRGAGHGFDLAFAHREAANMVADVLAMLTRVGEAAAHVQVYPRRRDAPDEGPEVNLYLASDDPAGLRLVLAALGLDHLPVTERETISERHDGLTRTTFYEVSSPHRGGPDTYWHVWCSRSERITDDQPVAVPDA